MDPRGRFLSVATYDEEGGVVVATEQEPFDEARRFDQGYVRRYRAALASPYRAGWGHELDVEAAPRVELIDGHIPHSTFERDDLRIEVTTFAPAGRRAVVQRWSYQNPGARALELGLRWDEPRVMRAPYPQLTEGGPLPASGLRARFAAFHGTGPLRLAPRSAGEWLVRVSLGSDPREEAMGAGAESASLPRTSSWPERRALAYARICALRVPPDGVCLLADHQILPLSWNRDAYYLATLLREHGELETVRAHLRWLFRVAERREGAWGRAHLANGRVKDRAFQLDQQCYPLLEAVEAGEAVTYRDEIAATLRALEARRAGDLFPTEETPADDPLSLPYHFSSHVLLWRTFDALARAGIPAPDAERVRRATLRAFVDAGRFAYATDGKGRYRHYHDANDVPTALAPAWGFCGAADKRWRATMAFAWSEENAGGYYAGAFGGLGSVHTAHPWPLGDLQDLIVARALRDTVRERRANERLESIATWDGLLPEAYDEWTGEVRSRHWFAWPAALRATLARASMTAGE